MDEDDQKANDECGICLEALTGAAVILPCTHKFCASCLDGWKSKFSSATKKERSKACPLCRKKIPPSKDIFIQLEWHRREIHRLEARGDNTSGYYLNHLEQIKRLEEEIGDYDGEGIDYDGCIELPKFIFDAVMTNDIKNVLDWLGYPVDIDMKRLNARYPDHLNSTLLHLAIYTTNADLMSILLQYGADVNALDAKGWNLLIHATKHSFAQVKILLEWGAEIILPPNMVHLVRRKEKNESNRDAFIRIIKKAGNNKVVNLISSEFGGRRCEVINLPNHPQLNGKTCIVEKYIAKKDKYKIIFEGAGNAALVGPNNLKRRDRTQLDCGYYISFKNGKMSRREFATKEDCHAYVSSLGGDVKETTKELASMKL